MLLYWTSSATTQETVFVYIYLYCTSIPQIVETPTLHQMCRHTYETGTCFIISDHFFYMKDFIFFFRKTIKEMQQKKTEEKKIEIRNPEARVQQ